MGDDAILIFSDLAEDLKDGYVRDIPLSLDGFEVVALNKPNWAATTSIRA